MKALASNYDLTPKAGRMLRYLGWLVAFLTGVDLLPCRDCRRVTTWRDPAGLPRHPWECGRG